MFRQSRDCHACDALAPIVKELEAALLEYVERYGPTDRARSILIEISQSSKYPIISDNCDPFPAPKS